MAERVRNEDVVARELEAIRADASKRIRVL
jgi:hypothetical protein